ncbi:hypothetical protein O181_095860 [Austropuccinia psidii MF-1]|uniref:Uncharacterized protein n=1 Tax=Austropuccinia psidii MF-1 TaxID=1389203 RepID=A0A9Q3PCG9_9BASI|nr:hypothetical protein [Austropuccinia psidii MF-1]
MEKALVQSVGYIYTADIPFNEDDDDERRRRQGSRCKQRVAHGTIISMRFSSALHSLSSISFGFLVKYTLQASEVQQAPAIKTPNRVADGFPIICQHEFRREFPMRYCLDSIDQEWSCDPGRCFILDYDYQRYELNPRDSNFYFFNCAGPKIMSWRFRFKINSYIEAGENVFVTDGYVDDEHVVDPDKRAYKCPMSVKVNAKRIACTACNLRGKKPKKPKH